MRVADDADENLGDELEEDPWGLGSDIRELVQLIYAQDDEIAKLRKEMRSLRSGMKRILAAVALAKPRDEGEDDKDDGAQ